MPIAKRLNRRAVLRGVAGAALALPALEAMGEIVTSNPPKDSAHSTQPTGCHSRRKRMGSATGAGFQQLKKTVSFDLASPPNHWLLFRDHVSFMVACTTKTEQKPIRTVCSDMWLTGAPLHSPKPGAFNSSDWIKSSRSTPDNIVVSHRWYCR